MCVCACIRVSVYICMLVYMCMYVCMFVCINLRMCGCTHLLCMYSLIQWYTSGVDRNGNRQWDGDGNSFTSQVAFWIDPASETTVPSTGRYVEAHLVYEYSSKNVLNLLLRTAEWANRRSYLSYASLSALRQALKFNNVLFKN